VEAILMAPRLEVLKDDTTARVYFYPDEGRPASTPSVAIHDENGNVITAAATTNVTLSTANTTTSASAAVGAQSITLTAVTGFEVGKTYLLTNALSQKEWITIRSINASTKVVGLDERLEYLHASGATVVGCYFYRTLQAAETANLEQGWRAIATYAVSSINHTRRTYFDVVKVQLHSPLTVAFVKKYMPDLMPREHAQTRGSDYAGLRQAAWETIQNRIRQYSAEENEFRPALNRTPEYLDEWALDMFKLLAFRDGGVRQILRDIEPTEALRTLERNENLSRDRSLSTCSWDKNEDDVVSSDEANVPRMDLVR
jgi:hypothetical protein